MKNERRSSIGMLIDLSFFFFYGILSYTGGSWCNVQSKRYKLLYPEGWNDQTYTDSLTPDDMEKIFSDIDRLKRLHFQINKKEEAL
ncbi:hypothetical protein [Bacillus sp. 1P06AnD]|uniref:hypothetical protein n=1 Tax=Bacillus sp. 1P06AnD TaxID=3132208 RepID=UPI0039A0FA4D